MSDEELRLENFCDLICRFDEERYRSNMKDKLRSYRVPHFSDSLKDDTSDG